MIRWIAILLLVPACIWLGYVILAPSSAEHSLFLDVAFVGLVLLFLSLLVGEMVARLHESIGDRHHGDASDGSPPEQPGRWATERSESRSRQNSPA